jgi:hypothetical protein
LAATLGPQPRAILLHGHRGEIDAFVIGNINRDNSPLAVRLSSKALHVVAFSAITGRTVSSNGGLISEQTVLQG